MILKLLWFCLIVISGQIVLVGAAPLQVINVTAVGATPNYVYGVNDVVLLAVTFSDTISEPNVSSQCAQLDAFITLNSGASAAAYFVPMSILGSVPPLDTNQLYYLYLITPGDDASTLTVSPSGLLPPIYQDDPACNYIVPAAIIVSPRVIIATTAPRVQSVTTRMPSGTYTAGQMLSILVRFSEPVHLVQGGQPPQLELNCRALANFSAFSVTPDTLVFSYTVGYGEATPPGKYLDVSNVTSLMMNGGILYSIRSGLVANTLVPYPGAPGSLSYQPHAGAGVQIIIVSTGQKFPPLYYNPLRMPTDDGSGPSHPVIVTVKVQVNAVFQVDPKDQSFKGDATIMQEWVDPRFVNVGLQPSTIFTLNSNFPTNIWWPELSMVNERDKPSPFDGKLIVMNDGRVQLWYRYIGLFSSPMNVREYPFDTQIFTIQLRPLEYPSNYVMFQILDDKAIDHLNQRLELLNDSSFEFYGFGQDVETVTQGLFQGYSLLTTSWHAQRLTTYNAVNVLFPLAIICFAVFMSYFMPLKSDSRITICVSGIAGTLAFSFVVVNNAPPVNYLTRMTLYIFQTYVYSVCTLVFQIFVRAVHRPLENLKEKDKEKKDKSDDTKPQTPAVLPAVSPSVSVHPDTSESAPLLAKVDIYSSPSTSYGAAASYQLDTGVMIELKPMLEGEQEKAANAKKGEEKEEKEEEEETVMFFGRIVLNRKTKKMWLHRLDMINNGGRLLYASLFVLSTSLVLKAF